MFMVVASEVRFIDLKEVIPMDVENNTLNDLESSKRNHKVQITDIAIAKVPYIKYKEIPEEHYDNLYELAKYVLQLSKDENDSNEVAVVYSMDFVNLVADNQEYMGVSFGTEHEVDPEGSTVSYHLIHSTPECIVVCLHNHPNLSKFSLDDVQFFLRKHSVKMIVIVTNLGSISYLVKGNSYNRIEAIKIYNDAVSIHNLGTDLKNAQRAANHFLKECYRAGIIYDDR